MRLVLALAFLATTTTAGITQDRQVTLSVPAEIADSGLLKHILPRFKLKTQIAVKLDDAGEVSLLAGDGLPVFQWQNVVYGVSPDQADAYAGRFIDWLTSDIGQNTITSFGDGAFTLPEIEAAVVEEVTFEGDVTAGEDLAHLHCGRCHVVSKKNRMGGIGSTPSFGAMKNFTDWQARFSGFYSLNPHPAFTQIEDLTDPFDPERPPMVAPVELNYAEYEAILAYVGKLPVKDLGGAIVSQ